MASQTALSKTFAGDGVYTVARALLWPAVKIAFRQSCIGADNVPRHGAVLLVANHQSYLDPVLLGTLLPRVLDFVARDSLFTNPAFGWLIRELNALPIKRGQGDISAIKESLRRLKAGRAVLFFPEGTRSRDGRVARLQGGVISLARRAGVPIVPCAIEGAFEIWPRTSKIPRPAKVWVEYGRPIPPSTWDGLADEAAATTLTQILRDLHNHLRGRAGRLRFNYTDGDSQEQAE
jgi:1-acyl-sn-glycerol-3-phosphate acyltransferase